VKKHKKNLYVSSEGGRQRPLQLLKFMSKLTDFLTEKLVNITKKKWSKFEILLEQWSNKGPVIIYGGGGTEEKRFSW
jgi:hypothetical protein